MISGIGSFPGASTSLCRSGAGTKSAVDAEDFDPQGLKRMGRIDSGNRRTPVQSSETKDKVSILWTKSSADARKRGWRERDTNRITGTRKVIEAAFYISPIAISHGGLAVLRNVALTFTGLADGKGPTLRMADQDKFLDQTWTICSGTGPKTTGQLTSPMGTALDEIGGWSVGLAR